MRKTNLILVILILLTFTIEAKELSGSDWEHVFIPAGMHLMVSQGLTLGGVEAKTSETVSLALVLSLNIAKEYYDYRKDGVSTLEDLQLSMTGIITAYYINQAINRLAKRK